MPKSEQTTRVVGCLGDTQVAVQRYHDGSGQDILVQATVLGERLACFLAALNSSEPGVEQVAGRQVHVVSHSRDLDGCLLDLIDLLIDLRWAHPRLVQLELVVPAPSQAEGGETEAWA